MASIFISYRRKDYEYGVSALEKHLRTYFGSTSVLLDQESFSAGTDWQAEMKSAVIQSSVILCAIGDSWGRVNISNEDTDYLHEELFIARSLGKPIIPVVIGNGDGRQALANLPKDIAWINKLHVVDCSGPDLGRVNVLERAIESIVPLSSGKRGAIATMTAELFYSLLYPVSAGGTALRGTTWEMTSALVGLGVSMMALLMLGMSITGDFYILENLGKVLGIGCLFVGLVFGMTSAIIRLGSARVNSKGRFVYSMRLCSAIICCAAIYLTLWLSFFPEKAFQQILSAMDAGGPMSPDAVKIIDQIPVKFTLILGVFNLCLIFHLFYIIWGFVRSMAAVVRTSRLLAVAFFVALVSATAAMAWASFSAGDSEPTPPTKNTTRMADQLPREFSFSNGADRLTERGTELLPIKIQAHGVARIDRDIVILDVRNLRIENRTSASITADYIHFTLGRRIDGKFTWTDPVPYSNQVNIGPIEAGTERLLENFSLRTRLHPSMNSGETVLVVWVTINSKAQHPIGDGGDSILRW